VKTFLSIQYLRGAAALAVVAFHALQWTGGGFEVGRAGVDVFFVISGFIMWTIADGRAVSAGGFLWRRLTRVAPAYWIATLGVAGVALAWPAFLPQLRLGWAHLGLSLAFIPHDDPAGLPFPLLPPGWTLTYEAVFYLIFAAALLAPARTRLALVAAGLAIVSFAGFWWRDAYPLGANPLMLEFAAGACLGRLARTGALPGRRAGWAMLAAGVAAFVAMEAAGWTSELWRPLVWGAPALLIVAGAVTIEARGGIGDCEPARGLGDASYSIYLWHLPAVALVAHTIGFGRPWLFVPLAMATSIAAGLAGRALVEKPLMALLRRRSTGALAGSRNAPPTELFKDLA